MRVFLILFTLLFSLNSLAIVNDSGMEVLRKSAESDVPGSYVLRTKLISIDAGSGLATEAKQDVGNGYLSNISGKLDTTNGYLLDVKNQLITLNTVDFSTSAKQDAGNSYLNSLDSKIPSNLQTLNLASQPTDSNYGLITTSVIHGHTTTGGGGYVDVKVSPSGALSVDATVSSSALPTGAATSALQTTGNSNLSSIDTKLTSQATAANQTTANSSLSSIDTKLNSQATASNQATGNTSLSNLDTNLGAKADAAATTDTGTFSLISLFKRSLQSLTSILSAIQSTLNISPIDRVVSGSFTANAQTLTLTSTGCSTAVIQVSGSYTGTITPTVSADGGVNFASSSPQIYLEPNSTVGTTIVNVAGIWTVPISGRDALKLTASGWSAGTATITMKCSAGVSRVQVDSPNTNNFLATVSQAGSPWGQNLSQVGSNTVLTGNGVTGTGSQRVTIASDNTPFSIKLQDGSGNNLTSQSAGSQRALDTVSYPVDGFKATYRAAAVNVASATTPTDICTLTGSGTKTIRVTMVTISGTQTTTSIRDILLIKRSSADSGGTSSSLTAVPMDSNDAAATATAKSYTANPTLGTTVGTIDSAKLVVDVTAVGANASAPPTYSFPLVNRGPKAVVLRGTGEVLAINLNSVTSAGGSFNCTFEWTEE